MTDNIDINVKYNVQGAGKVKAEQAKVNEVILKGTQATHGYTHAVTKQDSVTKGLLATKQKEFNLQSALIQKKRQESQAYLMATHTVNEHTGQVQKMSMWQKISVGQWKTAYPALTRVNNALNTVRWSMVNVAFGLAAIAAVASPFIILTRQGIQYEEQLRKIASVSGEMFQTQQGLQALTGAVAGVAVGRPATFAEAADAMLEFQRAGFGLSQAMSDVPHIIDLSVAGFTDLKKATQIVTSALHQFSSEGITAQQAADAIAKASVNSATTVEELGLALSYAGAMAASAGFSFEETTAALALLSNAGMRGSRAGTTLRQVISKVSTMSKQGEQSMNRLGVSFFTAEGHLKSLQEIFTQLSLVMEDMTPEERASFVGDMFEIRSRAGVQALLSIINESSTAIEDFSRILSDSGFASRTAADIQQASALRMKTAWGNLLIGLQPIATGMNNLFSKLIESVEDFSSRFLVAMRRGGITQAFGELPITLQLLSLIAVLRIAAPYIRKVDAALKSFVVTSTIAGMGPGAGVMAGPSMAVKTQTLTQTAPIGQFTKGAGFGVMASPALTKHYVAQTVSVQKLSVAKGAAAKAGFTLAKAKGALAVAGGKLLAFLGPVGIVLGALAGTYLLVSKRVRNMSRQTEEQIAILMRYQTQIDILQAREDYYYSQGMTASAKAVAQLRQDFEEKDKEFDKFTKRASRATSLYEDYWKNTALGVTNKISMISNAIASLSAFQVLGWRAVRMTPEERVEAIAKLEEEKRKEHLDYQENAIANEEKRVETEQRAIYAIGTYVDNMINNMDDFEKHSNSNLNTLIKTSGRYEQLVALENDRKQVHKDIEDGVISEEEGTRRIQEIETVRLRHIHSMVPVLLEQSAVYGDIAAASNVALAREIQRLDTIRVIGRELADIIDEYDRMMTPQANNIFGQLGDEGMLFGIGGALDNLRQHLPEAVNDIDNLIDAFWNNYDLLRNYEKQLYVVNDAIEQFNRLIAIEEAALKGLNDQLNIVNDTISQLSNQRFVGETDLDKLIFGISQDVKRAALESMGITDVYQFIQDAVGGVEGAFDGVLAAMREVNDATKESEDAYKAWETTVQAHIKALVIQGNQLGRSATEAVRHHKTMLMSVRKFGEEDTKQKTDEELMLDALTAARDYYYGGMHEQVNLAIQAQEDLSSIHNDTADTVIAALEREWKARDPIITQIKEHERELNRLRTTHLIGGQTLDYYTKEQARLQNEIYLTVQAITGPGGLILAHNEEGASVRILAAEYAELARQMDRARRPTTGGSSTITVPTTTDSAGNVHVPGGGIISGPDQNMSPAPGIVFVPSSTSTSPLSGSNILPVSSLLAGQYFNDFIMRPNSSPIRFSPDDTIIGVKETEASGSLVGGGTITIQNININGVNSNNPRQLSKALVAEIKRELRSM